jgi:hypothetical protein
MSKFKPGDWVRYTDLPLDKKTRLKYLHTEYMHREFPILIGNCYDYNNYVARGAHTGNQDELKARFL